MILWRMDRLTMISLVVVIFSFVSGKMRHDLQNVFPVVVL